MTTEKSDAQNFSYYTIASICAVLGLFWYFRRTIYQKYFAWIMHIFASKVYFDSLNDMKVNLFQCVHDYKNQLDKDLAVLEVGTGSATNLTYLPPNTKLVCLDPNPQFEKYAKEHVKKEGSSLSVDFVHGYAEKLQFEDESFDVVVCTLVLCSVLDMKKCLQEFKRVLKPGGKYVFMEHVAYEDKTSWTWTFQWMMNPVQRYLFDDCETTRDTETYIMAAGFSDVSLKRCAPEIFAVWYRPTILGVATK
ncbi:putative methyltransferase-like protein 7A [Mercenaria mercenaria]|uniref:putative methyltransferase-like protein 7A n=1 Tax=Mercenaria mercenaria TaxID=6596 RepID=UPI001E1D4E67|nr:putative methyltransferase-like protein 7A [Mercenaria mercenaria]